MTSDQTPTYEYEGAAREHKGTFITFEGGEGTGKSTQIRLLQARLVAAGYHVLRLREPGGTHTGEEIRAILLDPKNTDIDPLSELLLYEAARAQLVREVILPTLDKGCVVLCDRFTDSTLAYQGIARGLGVDLVRRANEVGSDGLVPDRTILLVRELNDAMENATKDGADRLEREGLAFHKRVNEAFGHIHALDFGRIRRVYCAQTKQETAQHVYDEVADLLPNAKDIDFKVTQELIDKIKSNRRLEQWQCDDTADDASGDVTGDAPGSATGATGAFDTSGATGDENHNGNNA
ncbi:MAG: dTMP kinase [Coriobacteriales bacterium]|jgi:dTMP kinase|nr:dTMP kinase [Coriobacteriales bacterium]